MTNDVLPEHVYEALTNVFKSRLYSLIHTIRTHGPHFSCTTILPKSGADVRRLLDSMDDELLETVYEQAQFAILVALMVNHKTTLPTEEVILRLGSPSQPPSPSDN